MQWKAIRQAGKERSVVTVSSSYFFNNLCARHRRRSRPIVVDLLTVRSLLNWNIHIRHQHDIPVRCGVKARNLIPIVVASCVDCEHNTIQQITGSALATVNVATNNRQVVWQSHSSTTPLTPNYFIIYREASATHWWLAAVMKIGVVRWVFKRNAQ